MESGIELFDAALEVFERRGGAKSFNLLSDVAPTHAMMPWEPRFRDCTAVIGKPLNLAGERRLEVGGSLGDGGGEVSRPTPCITFCTDSVKFRGYPGAVIGRGFESIIEKPCERLVGRLMETFEDKQFVEMFVKLVLVAAGEEEATTFADISAGVKAIAAAAESEKGWSNDDEPLDCRKPASSDAIASAALLTGCMLIFALSAFSSSFATVKVALLRGDESSVDRLDFR